MAKEVKSMCSEKNLEYIILYLKNLQFRNNLYVSTPKRRVPQFGINYYRGRNWLKLIYIYIYRH